MRRMRVVLTSVLVVMLAMVASCGDDSEPFPPFVPSEGEHRVLFIGNSLTTSNDLPRTLEYVGALGGESIITTTIAFGGVSLADHWAMNNARAEIEKGGWEYVVLQQGPSALESSRTSLIAETKRFNQRIRAKGARAALYMVWPDTQFFGDFPRVAGSYLNAAEAVDGLFLPAGLGWVAAWEEDSQLALYGSDGFHPSPMGTFLAALVIYERLTGKDARDLPATAEVQGVPLDIPESTVRLLQRAAHEANTWYQYPW